MPEHPPPPPTGKTTGESVELIQWIKVIVTGPYSDEVKEKEIRIALK